MPPALDARLASALGIDPSASERELAEAVARAGNREAPTGREAVTVLALVARAAEAVLADRLFERISSAEVANLIQQRAEVRGTLRAKAARELGLPASDLVWLLGEDLYGCLIDAGLFSPPS